VQLKIEDVSGPVMLCGVEIGDSRESLAKS
jgi:hypothetical protein